MPFTNPTDDAKTKILKWVLFLPVLVNSLWDLFHQSPIGK